MSIVLRAPFSDYYDPDQVSAETGLECLDLTRTKQADAEEADINTIVRKFGITGKLPEGVRAPTYADFDDVFDFHTAQNAIIAAKDSFMRMPAAIRARFDNDPGAFVDFCSDPENVDELGKMGLLAPGSLGTEPSVPVADVAAGDLRPEASGTPKA